MVCLSRCHLFTSLLAVITVGTANAFVSRPLHFGLPSTRTSVAYRTDAENDLVETVTTSQAAPLGVETVLWDDENPRSRSGPKNGKQQFPKKALIPDDEAVEKIAQRLKGGHELDHDPSLVEFVSSEEYHQVPTLCDVSTDCLAGDDHYPIAAMLQGSAPYIANHLGETAVFYIPGEWLHKPKQLFDSFLQDISLARLMGIKIVLVADCRLEEDASCPQQDFQYAHECHNTLRVTDDDAIRAMEKEAGYIRNEIERKLNRYLKKTLLKNVNEQEGNVVGGNMFYSARSFGIVRDQDFQHTGFVQRVYTDNIENALENNDVVLLTTVGCSTQGDSVNVNGHHLAATVAASLNAYKLIFMADQGSVLSQKNSQGKFYQEIPLSFTQNLCDYHKVRVHKTGFANFEHARQTLEPRAVELLLNLAWGSWAVDQGVTRAHIVNPKDGALLEELFTSKNGANTCLYHDDENLADDEGASWLSEEDENDFADFFAEAACQKNALNGVQS